MRIIGRTFSLYLAGFKGFFLASAGVSLLGAVVSVLLVVLGGLLIDRGDAASSSAVLSAGGALGFFLMLLAAIVVFWLYCLGAALVVAIAARHGQGGEARLGQVVREVVGNRGLREWLSRFVGTGALMLLLAGVLLGVLSMSCGQSGIAAVWMGVFLVGFHLSYVIPRLPGLCAAVLDRQGGAASYRVARILVGDSFGRMFLTLGAVSLIAVFVGTVVDIVLGLLVGLLGQILAGPLTQAALGLLAGFCSSALVTPLLPIGVYLLYGHLKARSGLDLSEAHAGRDDTESKPAKTWGTRALDVAPWAVVCLLVLVTVYYAYPIAIGDMLSKLGAQRLAARGYLRACGGLHWRLPLPWMRRDYDRGVREAARSKLSATGQTALPVLVAAFDHPNAELRGEAVRVVRDSGSAAVPLLMGALAHESALVRDGVGYCLAGLVWKAEPDDPAFRQYVPGLGEILQDPECGARSHVAYALFHFAGFKNVAKLGVPPEIPEELLDRVPVHLRSKVSRPSDGQEILARHSRALAALRQARINVDDIAAVLMRSIVDADPYWLDCLACEPLYAACNKATQQQIAQALKTGATAERPAAHLTIARGLKGAGDWAMPILERLVDAAEPRIRIAAAIAIAPMVRRASEATTPGRERRDDAVRVLRETIKDKRRWDLWREAGLALAALTRDGTEVEKALARETLSSALASAAARGRLANIVELFANGGDVNWEGRPLESAAMYRQADAASLLIALGAHVNGVSKYGRTPLGAASLADSLVLVPGLGLSRGPKHACVKVLMAALDNVNAKDGSGRTSLHYVAEAGDTEIAKWLLDSGAEVDPRDGEGRTPLFGAAAKMIRVEGETAHLRQYKTRTDWNRQAVARNVAEHERLKGSVELLIANGADVNVRDNSGRALLEMAQKGQCKDAAEFLRAKGAEADQKRHKPRGKADIYVLDADGGDPVNLTSNAANDYRPAWSPDGKKIAFVSDRDGDLEIYVMNADGTSPVRLTRSRGNDRFPAWSPDGARIAFQSKRDGNCEIYVMNADGAEQTNLTKSPGCDHHPTWSPDRAKIAFCSKRNKKCDIYTMAADGTRVVSVTQRAGCDHHPAWCLDSKKLAFSAKLAGQWGICSLKLDGSAIQIVATVSSDARIAWSPDGSRLAYALANRTSDRLTILNADGSGTRTLGRLRGLYSDPAWSPDGAKIAASVSLLK